MRDGAGYVLACYAAAGVTLAVWFAMIGTKLRRLRQRGVPGALEGARGRRDG